MKLYRYDLTGDARFTYWDADRRRCEYQANMRAETLFGIEKGKARGVVREVEIPTTSADALAKWLNEETRR